MTARKLSRPKPHLTEHERLRDLILKRPSFHFFEPPLPEPDDTGNVPACDYPGCPESPVFRMLRIRVGCGLLLSYADLALILADSRDRARLRIQTVTPLMSELGNRIRVTQRFPDKVSS